MADLKVTSKQNLPFWCEKSIWNTSSCIGNLLLHVQFVFFKVTFTRDKKGKCLVPLAEIIGNSSVGNLEAFLFQLKVKSPGNVWVEIQFGLQEQCVGYIT